MHGRNASNGEAIALRGISKAFGSVTVLKATELAVHKSEFLTLLGPSGSGKTTLLNLISGAITPSSGEILLAGRDITHMPPRDRGIGMVFQNYALMPHMTVFENVAYPLRARREPSEAIRRKVLDALDRVGLKGFDDRKPRQLSGGQQQRVGIARCIVYSPAIIMMDEPLGALDKNLREQMQTEIKRLHQELGTTIIYVTHDQEEALNMSDRICLMKTGEIAQLGTPDELYFRPNSRFVAEFIGESNLLCGKSVAANSVAIDGAGAVLVPSSERGLGSDVLIMVRPEKMHIFASDADTPAGHNVLRGVVEAISFIGGMTRITVKTAHGVSVTAKIISGPACTRPELGSAAKLSWSPTESVVLNG
ncbi:ABC transporter ATP-binding protein [Bradyrhizobium iriomotense]|uniref:Polyamine-transporting ATPase n=1 Tax=Bradyrhizobium iriomotense TaxID=441950 RepID=A0ABQ6B9N1_9BRAD|nr:ABC transporter ATP-binding protein [Bradyrhizobium iriomotense]GLR90405.1 polyamine-transporting ATPase [Bradyrhizobium iriomotense]